jgi:zinc transporter, ZIP family
VLNVILFGLAASSALVIGAVAGAYWTPPKPLLASALAFASGALITALAFDLFQESFERGGAFLSAIGVVGGAVSFVVADAPSHATSENDPIGRWVNSCLCSMAENGPYSRGPTW